MAAALKVVLSVLALQMVFIGIGQANPIQDLVDLLTGAGDYTQPPPSGPPSPGSDVSVPPVPSGAPQVPPVPSGAPQVPPVPSEEPQVPSGAPQVPPVPSAEPQVPSGAPVAA